MNEETKEINLAEFNMCTGCGVCNLVCGNDCIVMQPNYAGELYPKLNKDKCISCGLCESACHILSPIPKNDPIKLYAAWSLDPVIRKTAASGGIASEIYRYAIENGICAYGVRCDAEGNVWFDEVCADSDIKESRNSKYVFSDIQVALPRIKEKISNGKEVILICLPCQAAAALKYLGSRENLILVDIVCKGVCSNLFLKQHLSGIASKTGDEAVTYSFRDPEYGTENYNFTVRSKDRVLYRKSVHSFDTYQLGYHKGLIFRENCYNCRYTSKERMGDLTISDFGGVGCIEPCNYSNKSVSAILVSSDKGNILLKELEKKKRIFTEQRPFEEAFCYDSQFDHPTNKHPKHALFREKLEVTGNFESSARKALRGDAAALLIYHIKACIVKPYLRLKKLIGIDTAKT